VKAIVAEERTNCVAIARGAGKDENAEDGSEKRPDAMTAWI
jgi:hypothetical protein